jgi:transposase
MTCGHPPAVAAARAAETKRRSPARPRPGGAHRHPVRPAHRLPLANLAARAGLRERLDLLAQAARLAGCRGVGPAPSPPARPARLTRPHRLVTRLAGFRERPGEKGGEETGPNPTDRGRPGTKRHLLVDRNGIPLAVLISPANRHDSRMLEPLLDAVRPIKGLWGRPRTRPAKRHADKAYDFGCCRAACRRRGITPRIARRGIEPSEKLGRHRWVVERTLAWLARYRRLTVRYERLAEMHLAFVTIAGALICWRCLQRGASRAGGRRCAATGT